MMETLGFFENDKHDPTLDCPPDSGCYFITPALVAVGVGSETAAILGPVIGAGLGAAGSAATGGDPLTGALLGGGLSALGGFSGATSAIGDAFGQSTSGLGGALSSTLGLGGDSVSAGTNVPGASSTGGYTLSTDASGTPTATYNPTSGLSAAGPLAQTTGTAASNGLNGINKNLMLMAGLSGVGSLFGGKPQVYSGPMPGPSSNAATLGPTFNQGLTTYGGQTRTLNPAATSMPTSSYYTYGETGQQPWFNNNSLQSYGWPVGAAHGGAIHGGALTRASGGPMFSTANGQHYVKGMGDGTSDSVPAQLSDGEYVLTAADLARLGQGSNEAGAKKLDQFRAALAREAGQKQFIPAKTRGALSALTKAA